MSAMTNVTFRVPLSRTTLRGLYVTVNPPRKFFGVFRAELRGYSSLGLGLLTVQYLP